MILVFYMYNPDESVGKPGIGGTDDVISECPNLQGRMR